MVDASTQTPVHNSTQTESGEGSPGAMGPYDVRRMDNVVMFTGHLPDQREISVQKQKDRVVVKFFPGLNSETGNEDCLKKSFSIRFQSVPVGQGSVDGSVGSDGEDLVWDDFRESAELHSNNLDISEEAVFLTQRARDSGIVRSPKDSALIGTEPSDLSEALRNLSSSRVDTVSETGSYCSSTGAMPSLDRQSNSSLDTANSSSNSATASGSLFRNGRQICEIAEMISDSRQCLEPVSRQIFSRLITYDPHVVPGWFKKYQSPSLTITTVENFLLQSFAKWMGWLDADGKNMNLFTGTSHRLSPKFIFWLENNTSAFECISQAAQLHANVRRDVHRCFCGEIRVIDRVQLYETLSFKQGDKASLKNKSGNLQLLSECSSAIFFYFRNFVSKIAEVIESKKYRAEKAAVARKIAVHTILEKQRGNIDLLKACVSYNLAVMLIEKEYASTGLAKYDASRRVNGQLDFEVDYSRIEPNNLEVIKKLIILIEALEDEGRVIIENYKDTIDALPRVRDGKSFEERVLQMCKYDTGYASSPLQGIKSTLRAILENHPANLTGLPG
ncbi:hypothetical protein [Endozoicomonas sp. SCSIO W0465]|uniref:hypothetical protein n=1 Tax=Endozoicomonas sp. SCSIO W0465 TaxID=2918516 RepID=UPI00207612C3|nr:hypothetical protein [Endozoicomonas sp. SCSIO W0465]USE37182.1 hypothetical protein MJO57_02830 [Endozoicomonas sp. SCSIO W0465]